VSGWEGIGLPTHNIRKSPVSVGALDRPGYAIVVDNVAGTAVEVPECVLSAEIQDDLRRQRRARMRVWRNDPPQAAGDCSSPAESTTYRERLDAEIARQPKLCPNAGCGSDDIVPCFPGTAWQCSTCDLVWEPER
jgi:hypothetical protein